MKMSRGLVVALVVLGVIAIMVANGASQYNNLVTQETQVDAQWAQVQNQLVRRADLIPNLVATTKGYAAHEAGVFENIAAARSRLLDAGTPDQQIAANNELDSALSRLLVLVENYPQLKADASFRALQDELAGTENRIAVERGRYNTAVQVYNTSIRRFPTNLYARMFGLQDKAFFAAPEGADKPPVVDFSTK